MNETISLIRRHRSVRDYADAAVPDDHVRLAVEAGQAASTSSAIQSYCVLRIRDDGHRRRLAELCGNQDHITRCGAFFVVCGDSRRHRLLCRRAGRTYDARLEAFLLAVIDATLFAQNLVLAFESLGYGICYIGGLRNNLAEVDQLLEIPPGVYPLYGLCVGVPDEEPTPRPRLGADAVLFDDRYPDDEEILRLVEAYDTVYRRWLDERGVAHDDWSNRMAEKFAEPRRTDVGPYYRGKGADLS